MAENNQPSLLMETCSAENNLVSIIRKFVESFFYLQLRSIAREKLSLVLT